MLAARFDPARVSSLLLEGENLRLSMAALARVRVLLAAVDVVPSEPVADIVEVEEDTSSAALYSRAGSGGEDRQVQPTAPPQG